MTHLDNANLNYGIKQELSAIEQMFKTYQTNHDHDNLRILYQGLVGISRSLPSVNQDMQSMIEKYREFDR